MGLFGGPSRAGIEERIDRLLGNYDQYVFATFDSDLKDIQEYSLKNKGGTFGDIAVEKLCNMLPAAIGSKRLPAILDLMFGLAGNVPVLKTKVVGKACSLLPAAVNTRPEALPGILDALLVSCKNDESSRTTIIISVCDILQSVLSKDAAVAVNLVERTLAVNNDSGNPGKAAEYNPYIIIKSTDILPALATQNPALTEQLMKSMLFATRVPGTAKKLDPALVGSVIPDSENYCKTLVIKKGCSIVDLVVNQNPRTAVGLVQDMLVGAGNDKSIKDVVTRKSADSLNTLCTKDGAETVGLIKYMLAANYDDPAQIQMIVGKSCALLPVLATNQPADTLGLVQALLNAGIDDGVRGKVIGKACDVLGSLSANDSGAAFSLVQTMLGSVDGLPPLKAAVVTRAVDIIPGLVETNSQSAILLIQNLLSTAGDDAALARTVIEKVRDILPAAAEKNPGAVPGLLESILSGAGEDEALKKSILDTTFTAVPGMAATSKNKTNPATQVLDILLKKGATSPGLRKAYIQDSCQALFSVYDKGYGLGLLPRMQAAAAGDAAATQTLVESACALMPEFVRKDAAGALETLKALENSAGSDKALRATLVKTSGPVTSAVLQLAPGLENGYLKQYLSIAQNDADLRNAVLVDGACAFMPELARKDAKTALETLKTMENSAGSDKALRAAVVGTSGPVMAAAFQSMPELENGYLRQYLSIAQADGDLKEAVLQKACDTLLPLSRKNADAAGSVFQTILQSIGVDTEISCVFAEVAVARTNGAQVLILNPGNAVDQKIVIDQKQSSLQKAFVKAKKEDRSYSYYGQNKAYYDSIFKFLDESEKHMASAPRLKDLVKDRLEGKKTPPAAWPGTF